MDNHKDILSLGCQLLKLQGFYRPCLTLTLQTVVKDIYLSQNCITCKNKHERETVSTRHLANLHVAIIPHNFLFFVFVF